MKRLLSFTIFLWPFALAAQNSGVAHAVASITESDFYDRVTVIAHDSMMGRDTPSPGLDMTARWIGEEFRRFGLKAGGADGAYLQTYRIETVAPDFEGSIIRVSDGPALAFGSDVISAFGTPSEEEVTGGLSLLAGGNLPPGVGDDQIRGRHLVLIPPKTRVLGGDAPR